MPLRKIFKNNHPRVAGMLYVVAMPIGDIADLSPRALAILAQVDLIACEDTRRVAPLLAAHSIRTPTPSATSSITRSAAHPSWSSGCAAARESRW